MLQAVEARVLHSFTKTLAAGAGAAVSGGGSPLPTGLAVAAGNF